MVGIVGILLLGSLAWSAVAAMFSAVGEATGALSGARATPVRLTAIAVTATPRPADQPTVTVASRSAEPPTVTVAPTPQPTPAPSATPVPQGAAAPSPTPAVADGRAPWILLPLPAPGTKVPGGQATIEARGRGDAPISAMRLELDGAALPAATEQRSESTWRIFATTRVAPGQHTVRVTVIDDQGRSGGFRWTFEAAP
jgi:hypothetical protein